MVEHANEAAANAPMKVAVLVDLHYGASAGGHVRTWERIARAAAGLPDTGLDLTVHYSGRERTVIDLGPQVRLVTHVPMFSTERLPFLSHIPDHTDLAPFHLRLYRALGAVQVIHTTDAFFAFARTAERAATKGNIALVNSVHTDTPSYTRLFTRKTVERLFGAGRLSRTLLEGLKVHERAERDMLDRLVRHQARCGYALVSQPAERERALAALPPDRVRILRRGIDKQAFHPAWRDREWLTAEFGVPADRVVVLAVGRVNAGKNVMTLAASVRELADQGLPIHLFCAGKGDERERVIALLGDRATCPGVVEPARLAKVYASCDIFALPSEIEVFANVVMEALASGLPVLVAAAGGMGRIVREGHTGLVVGGAGTAPWTHALGRLTVDRPLRRQMAAEARQYAQEHLPSWEDVVREDLLPIWRAAAAEAAGTRSLGPVR